MQTVQQLYLIETIAKICFYAQDHVKYDENGTKKLKPSENLTGVDSWGVGFAMETVSHVVACLLANETELGRSGVDSNVIIDKLTEYNYSYSEWLDIAEELVEQYK